MLNEKFRNYTIPTSVPKQQQQEGGESEMTPSVEQLMTESALNEMKITELNGELEDRKEQIEQLNETLNRERERRRQLETHYLGSINHRNVVPKDFPNQVNHYHRSVSTVCLVSFSTETKFPLFRIMRCTILTTTTMGPSIVEIQCRV